MKRNKHYGKGGKFPLFLINKVNRIRRSTVGVLLIVVFAFSIMGLIGYGICYMVQTQRTRDIQEKLVEIKKDKDEDCQVSSIPIIDEVSSISMNDACATPQMLHKMAELYEINPDIIGWLFIEGTTINYPVMQTLENEDYYLSYDFYGEENKNGCLILDTDSIVGTGTKDCDYINGVAPSTNLIIHGHTMRSGEMFGNLKLYQNEEYGTEHNRIIFESLYEKRTYEVISVFYSQVYYKKDNVFKYYKFFQADTQQEFDDWYNNIRELSLYDTNVTAVFGDEFITLSCCAYHVEDGRFVVVGKRVE